jgi:hypothetical protein
MRYCFRDYKYDETRFFKYHSRKIRWNIKQHRQVIPSFNERVMTNFECHYIHYKVHNFDKDAIDIKTGKFIHSTWSGLSPADESFKLSNLPSYYVNSMSRDEAMRCSDKVDEICELTNLNGSKRYPQLQSLEVNRGCDLRRIRDWRQFAHSKPFPIV